MMFGYREMVSNPASYTINIIGFIGLFVTSHMACFKIGKNTYAKHRAYEKGDQSTNCPVTIILCVSIR